MTRMKISTLAVTDDGISINVVTADGRTIQLGYSGTVSHTMTVTREGTVMLNIAVDVVPRRKDNLSSSRWVP